MYDCTISVVEIPFDSRARIARPRIFVLSREQAKWRLGAKET